MKGSELMREKILVLDFGGQYNQLIARRVRDLCVYAEIKSFKTPIAEIKEQNYKGIIFTGGPNSVYDPKSPSYDPEILNLGVPVLGICYGAQLMAHLAGGKVNANAGASEYGKIELHKKGGLLLKGFPENSVCWMSHRDYIENVPQGFEVTAVTADCPCAAMENREKRLFAVQFHPEVNHTEYGTEIFKSFLFDVCGCKGDWIMSDFVEESIKNYREMLGDKKVLCALSGGVDSSVCAALMSKAIGKNLTCIFVDHGLMRKNEGDMVEKEFASAFDFNLIRVNCESRFLSKLSGVSDPERKRKIIGEEFIRVFEEESKKLGRMDYLMQGTIYPDVIESGTGDAAVIKSHHNVGGLPENVDFDGIIEPLRNLFKDEVRKVGLELGVPEFLVYRQPFPGPGLAIRIIGDVTPEKVAIVQDADAIYREEVDKLPASERPSQYFAALTNMRSVGVMGDGRTYDYAIALRAVTTTDFMTAEVTMLPPATITAAANRIVNEVKHINRVLFDYTTKPPATIEFE